MVKSFFCNKCGAHCNSFTKLHKHMFNSPNHTYNCPCCDVKLGNSLVKVVLHTRQYCSREQFMKAEAKLVEADPKKVRYYCERCRKGLPALSNLLKHYLEDHKGQVLCCSECDKKSANFLELSHHFREHPDNETESGSKTSLNNKPANEKQAPASAKSTQEKATPEARKPVGDKSKPSTASGNAKAAKLISKSLYCHKCGLKFPSFDKLHSHIFSAEKHQFDCANCEYKIGQTLVNIILHTKRFCSRDDFRKSEALAAPNKIRYYCERCGKGVTTLTDLFKHQSEHINEPLMCSQCDKVSTTFMGLLIHFREHTVVGNLHLKCQLCPLEFYAVEPFKLHYFAVHSRVSGIPYECDLCVEVFVDDDDKFLFHVQGHSIVNKPIAPGRPAHDVSKLTCEVCAKIFDTLDQCKAHKAKDHQVTADSTRECPLCDQSVAITSLSTHLIGHDKEKAAKLCKKSLYVQEGMEQSDEEDVVEEEDGADKDTEDQEEEEEQTTKRRCILPNPTSVPKPALGTVQPRPEHFAPIPSFGELQQKLTKPRCGQCGQEFFTVFALNEHVKSHRMDTFATIREPKSAPPQQTTNWANQTTYPLAQNTGWSRTYVPPQQTNVNTYQMSYNAQAQKTGWSRDSAPAQQAPGPNDNPWTSQTSYPPAQKTGWSSLYKQAVVAAQAPMYPKHTQQSYGAPPQKTYVIPEVPSPPPAPSFDRRTSPARERSSYEDDRDDDSRYQRRSSSGRDYGRERGSYKDGMEDDSRYQRRSSPARDYERSSRSRRSRSRESRNDRARSPYRKEDSRGGDYSGGDRKRRRSPYGGRDHY